MRLQIAVVSPSRSTRWLALQHWVAAGLTALLAGSSPLLVAVQKRTVSPDACRTARVPTM